MLLDPPTCQDLITIFPREVLVQALKLPEETTGNYRRTIQQHFWNRYLLTANNTATTETTSNFEIIFIARYPEVGTTLGYSQTSYSFPQEPDEAILLESSVV